jgi:hypothetical protein
VKANSSLEKLATQIDTELKNASHCAIYAPALTQAWPRDGRRRELQVMSFAQQHGWRLRFYKDGFCAIFDKWPR